MYRGLGENIIQALKEAKSKDQSTKQLESKITTMEKSVVGIIKEQQNKVTTSLREQTEVMESVPRITSELKKSTQELTKLMEKKDDKEQERSMCWSTTFQKVGPRTQKHAKNMMQPYSRVWWNHWWGTML